MAIERTLSIIKPDAVAKNVIGQIYARELAWKLPGEELVLLGQGDGAWLALRALADGPGLRGACLLNAWPRLADSPPRAQKSRNPGMIVESISAGRPWRQSSQGK